MKKSKKLFGSIVLVLLLCAGLGVFVYYHYFLSYAAFEIIKLHDISCQIRRELFNPNGNIVLGNPNGKITLIEITDYNCPFCRKLWPEVANLVHNNPDIKLVEKEYLVFDDRSELPAYAALAAAKQGKYAEMNKAMMTATKPLSKEELVSLAKSHNINIKKFITDLSNPAIHRQIDENVKVVKNINIVSFPAVIIAPTYMADSKEDKGLMLLYIGFPGSQEALPKMLDSVRDWVKNNGQIKASRNY